MVCGSLQVVKVLQILDKNRITGKFQAYCKKPSTSSDNDIDSVQYPIKAIPPEDFYLDNMLQASQDEHGLKPAFLESDAPTTDFKPTAKNF
ncbi:hypothetical protein AVEN_233262-1 [Araneus ventricosus]|uniref:Uncharacterized protein n=1 Tax=Araneus ventricosus TaxID=182803 RepID=A0A4Y2PD86_ARAVE|nr:hypothetical protein AVEN_233262-1 [Araneus ventricosus]